jgi:hypothetical protein
MTKYVFIHRQRSLFVLHHNMFQPHWVIVRCYMHSEVETCCDIIQLQSVALTMNEEGF